ncbi:GGDEF domain-containing protein [Aureibacillus halotolerans]|uniref:Diguanylate cyclase (GGDEF)-like protein n=1 Tax=Aureibacillus halotolerans TaxID=1508390 RepID=A0A4V3D558_9BACI|nr:GGDEF domain-containing protein [Aureibacillus halotolerans]TDQ38707.1 diguanylate cyclase (GGDEF)-like protein [Aureibacillus halotolerans]
MVKEHRGRWAGVSVWLGLMCISCVWFMTTWNRDILIIGIVIVGGGVAVYAGYRFDLIYNAMERDALTGVYNRRGFMRAFSKSVRNQRSRGNMDELTLLLIDADHFKKINDRYGHYIGDQVLCYMANCLQTIQDKQTIVARWGGDEFVVLLLADQVKTIEDHIHQTLQTYPSSQIIVKVSVGTAQYPKDGTQVDTLVDVADQRMYAAKKAVQS